MTAGVLPLNLAHGAMGRFETGRQDVTATETIAPIPQWFNGIKYRSTLEARWAIFFDAAGITADYEPEGYVVGGKPYRPDFLLRDCGTWVEVKGDPARLDLDLMRHAAVELPRPAPKREAGPPLMILGQVPPPPTASYGLGAYDWGFVSLGQAYPPSDCPVDFTYYGFGNYHKNCRPWWLGWVSPLPSDDHLAAKFALESCACEDEPCSEVIVEAYATARAHRFGRR